MEFHASFADGPFSCNVELKGTSVCSTFQKHLSHAGTAPSGDLMQILLSELYDSLFTLSGLTESYMKSEDPAEGSKESSDVPFPAVLHGLHARVPGPEMAALAPRPWL